MCSCLKGYRTIGLVVSLHSLIECLHDSGACSHFGKCLVVAAGIDTVAEEDVNHVVFRVNPEAGARKARMTEYRRTCFLTG